MAKDADGSSEPQKEGYWARQAQMAKAEVAALGRGGLNDARNIIMGPWGEGEKTPGTLGYPTSQMVTEQFPESDHEKWLRERSESAKGHDESRGKGMSR